VEQTGPSPVGGPNACPFLALEFDRDRRSDRPDYRHRCYAEPTPAPRAIAHQEQYCLSPRFAACPIFQDWATRSAARPVPAGAAREEGGPTPEAAVAETPVADAAGAQEPAGGEQLAAFRSDQEEPPPAAPAAPAANQVPAGPAEPPPGGEGAAPGSPPAGEEPPAAEEPAAPAFLSGRSARPPMRLAANPPASQSQLPAPDDSMRREDVVPSWEIDGRFGAQDPRQRDSRGQQIVTFLAVVLILALGIAAVFIIPSLLSGTPAASPSAPASMAPGASASATPLSSAEPSAPPTASTVPSLTPQPTPEASFRTYRVKKNDTLLKIARHFQINVNDILAANPQITDPNHIEPGQVIVIPVPAPSPSP
jgi:LysM repeat protein